MDWEQKCYEHVDWTEIKLENGHLIQYLGDSTTSNDKKGKIIKEGLKVGAEVGVPVALAVISPLYGAASKAAIEFYKRYDENKRKSIEELYNTVFQLKKERSFIGTGERETWMDSTKKVNLNDIAAGQFIKGLTCAFSSVGAKPKEVKSTKNMDFKYNLYLVGGPIPNAYTRNVLYGEYGKEAISPIKTPYKFRLDIEGHGSDSPLELKSISHEKEPNWYICDRGGNKINYGTPEIVNRVLIKDSFMIIKCKNIYPYAHENTKSFIFAGCHGLGTSAAGALIKNEIYIRKICSKVGDNDFQLVGQVSRQLYESGIYERFDEDSINIKICYIKELKY